MQLALRHLTTSLDTAREAAAALFVTVKEDRPRESHSLLDQIEDYVDDLRGSLELPTGAIKALDPNPFDRSAIRTVLVTCQEAVERANALSQDLAAVDMRNIPRYGEWAAWARCIEEQVVTVSSRLLETRRALGVAWSEFTEPSPSAAERPPEDVFIEAIHAKTFDWYKQADVKAQAILAFTGVFLAILIGSVLLKGETQVWHPGSSKLNLWGVGAVLALYLAGTCFCVLALWSRGMYWSDPGVYFFGNIAKLPENGSAFVALVREALNNQPQDRSSRASQVLLLSRNTLVKHRLVNAGVFCSTLALIGTVAMGMVFALR